jgi:hypothetical protein
MSDASQMILFAIQTPHGSILDVDSVTDSGPHSQEKSEPRLRYHLVIDAKQADQEDGKDNEIQIFQVETKHKPTSNHQEIYGRTEIPQQEQ